MANREQLNKKGSYKNTIIKYIYANGFLPGDLLYMFPFRLRKIQNAVAELKQSGIIETIKEEQNRKIKKAIVLKDYDNNKTLYEDSMPSIYPTLYMQYKTNTYEYLYRDATQSENIYRTISARMMFAWSGVPSYPDERKNLTATDGVPLDFAYYSADDLKYALTFNERSKKINPSRITGLYATYDCLYSVYNYNRSIMEITEMPEYKIQNAIYIDMIAKHNQKREHAAIIMYKKNKEQWITSHLVETNTYYKRSLNNFKYDSIYMIPMDENGRYIIQIMSEEKWKEKIISVCIPEDEREVKYMNTPCHGYNASKNTTTFIYCIPDIKKFSWFLMHAKANINNGTHKIICYDFQCQPPIT